MREIKFRVWDKKNEAMRGVHLVGGNLIFEYENNGYDFLELEIKELYPEYLEGVEDFEIMQYTGLKDEYDIEIYEGDIVEIAEQPLLRFEIVYSTEHAAFMRRWLSSLVSVTRECGSEEHIPPNTAFWKVIGNKYENPELLED